MTAVTRAVAAVLMHVHYYGTQIHTATKILTPTLVVRATAVSYNRKPVSGRASRRTYTVTIGAPNYRTRKFIKWCQKAGVRFPVQKIWLLSYPVPKSKPRARVRKR